MMTTMTNLTPDELTALGFTRQSVSHINDLPTDPQRAEEGEKKVNIDKEKLLERIDKVKEDVNDLGELFLSTHTRPLKYTTGHSAICEILNDVKTELSQPNLDDAIKVVERLWTEQPYHKAVNEFYHSILTALKGLKGE